MHSTTQLMVIPTFHIYIIFIYFLCVFYHLRRWSLNENLSFFSLIRSDIFTFGWNLKTMWWRNQRSVFISEECYRSLTIADVFKLCEHLGLKRNSSWRVHWSLHILILLYIYIIIITNHRGMEPMKVKEFPVPQTLSWTYLSVHYLYVCVYIYVYLYIYTLNAITKLTIWST